MGSLLSVLGSSAGGPPAELKQSAAKGFSETFGGAAPAALGVAPGRAEVLGNHTDYNEGLILACAIDRYVVISGKAAEGTVCRIASDAFPEVVEFDVSKPLDAYKQSGKTAWANYVIGVVSELVKLNVKVGGFEAYVTSNVPPGAGVSSSAAVEMATAHLLGCLFPDSVGQLDQLAKVKAAKAAENNFVGMGCGILDQFSSGFGKAGYLLFLDCRTLDYSYAPFTGAQFVLANTHAPHQLVDGKYGELRADCFAACERIAKAAGDDKITHLRDVDSEGLAKHTSALTPSQHKRAKHIVTENERVQQGIDALKAGDMVKMGSCMSGSHYSSRDDFGNSVALLDTMQRLAEGCNGFLGARLMGGGFGGSTINLVKEGQAEAFAEELSRKYEAETGLKPTVLITVPGDGAYGEDLLTGRTSKSGFCLSR